MGTGKKQGDLLVLLQDNIIDPNNVTKLFFKFIGKPQNIPVNQFLSAFKKERKKDFIFHMRILTDIDT